MKQRGLWLWKWSEGFSCRLQSMDSGCFPLLLPPSFLCSSPLRTSRLPTISAAALPPSLPVHLTAIRCSSIHTHNKETELIVDVQTHDSLNLTPEFQKLLFIDSCEGIDNSLRPYWSKAISGRARVIQAIDYMLEIIPTSCSKGNGVKLLLDHLEVDPDDAMAIGDGENDIEMLELVGWGIAMANGSPQTLAIADAHVRSNDEDGVVEALERFVLT